MVDISNILSLWCPRGLSVTEVIESQINPVMGWCIPQGPAMQLAVHFTTAWPPGNVDEPLGAGPIVLC